MLPTGRLAPRDVPSFTQYGPDGFGEELNLEALFATADARMRRRGRSLSRADEALYRALAAQLGGETCATGLVKSTDPLHIQVLQDWLNEFERVQLILRLSPRLRRKHGD